MSPSPRLRAPPGRYPVRTRWPGRPHQPEQELQKLSSVIHQIAESVLITDREGTIEYVNPAFEGITGYTRSEAIGKKPNILKSGQHGPAVYDALWETILAGKVYEGILVNRKKNGELYYEEKIITPIFNKRGHITHFVSSGRDITARCQAEENLRESERRLQELNAAKRQFFSMVIHEFNSPLTAVIGSLQMLSEWNILTDRSKEYLEMALRNANHIKHLVADLTDLSRLEAGTFSVVHARMDLQACVRLSCQALEHSARSAGLTFVYPREDRPPLRLYADAERLGQVVTNLLENAIRYAASTVRVEVVDRPVGVTILVENDGPPILNPNEIDRIFNVRVQFDVPGKPKGRSGLGLPIAKGLVEAHDGRILVENIQPVDGGGAEIQSGVRFKVELPKNEGEISAIGQSSSS